MVFPLIPLVGAAIGGLIGAAVGASIDKSRQLDSKLRYRPDTDGWLLMVSSDKVLRDDFFVIHARDKNNSYLKANTPFFADDTGYFLLTAKKTESITELYFPFGSVFSNGSEKLQIRVRGFRPRGNNVEFLGEDFYDLDFPYKTFSTSGLWRPMVGLCMAVARADKVITAEEVRFIRQFMTDDCGVPDSESEALKNLIKTEPSYRINDLIYMMKYRFPSIEGRNVIEVLFRVAIADGNPNKAEIDILKIIAEQYDVTEQEWLQIAEYYGFNSGNKIGQYMEMLGLCGSPDEAEIKYAYKIKIKDFHPDKYQSQNLPDAVIKMLHDKSTDLATARDELLKYFGYL